MLLLLLLVLLLVATALAPEVALIVEVPC